MKIKLFFISGLLFFLSTVFSENVFASITSNGSTDSKYSAFWNRMDSLQKKGLNRSALDLSVEIFNAAQGDKNSAQLVKAMIHRLKFQSYVEEDALLKNISDLETETRKATFPENLIMHSMLAELYWGFYQSNRYRFINRSETTGIKSEDPATWDSRKIVERCLEHYAASLEQSIQSKKTAIAIFDEIITKEDSSDGRKYRPTLYDFLAHRALDFYMNTETGLTQPAEKFNLNAGEYFQQASVFIKTTISTADTTDLKYKACILFQQVLLFHLTDSDPIAFIDADLKRLQFIWSTTNVSGKDSLYVDALQHIASKYTAHPLVTEVLYALAGVYETSGNQYNPQTTEDHKWDLQKAIGHCNMALELFPESSGSRRCLALKERILFPSISFITEEVNPMGKVSRARVEYKNLNKVFLQLFIENSDSIRIWEQEGEPLINYFKRSKALQSWSVDLPVDTDLQFHNLEVAVPALDFGKYILVISDEENYSTEKNIYSYASFRISEMSLLSRNIKSGAYEFFVLDRTTGVPLRNVAAEIFTQTYNRLTNTYDPEILANYLSDDEGRFEVKSTNDNSRNFNVKLKSGNDVLYLNEGFYQYRNRERSGNNPGRTVFFTDRSIYRPGQLVFYKALLLEIKNEIPSILPNQNTTIQFFDVNSQLISEQKLKSNKYGTVNGVFAAPGGTLNGVMRIQNANGSVVFSVEEYKRPKFETKIDPVEGTYKIGSVVNVSGNAMTYSGVGVDAAQVKYRVSRIANFPPWCYWYRGMFPESPAQEIVSGETNTDANGKFSINFIAQVDENVSKKFQPVFNYQVSVDVTDINGETRSAQTTISAGYTSLVLSSDLPEALDLDKMNSHLLRAENLSGRAVPANVALKIYRISEPGRLLRNRLWPATDKRIYSKEEFISLFPNDVYENEDDFLKWAKEELVWSETLNTAIDTLIKFIPEKWSAGFYLLEGSAVDSFGTEVKLIQYFTGFRSSHKNPARKLTEWVHVLKNDAQPGESDKILLSTAERNVRVLVQTELHNEIISRQWIRMNNEQRILEIPVKEEYRGNFSVYINFVKNGRSYSESFVMKVPWDTKELNIEYETFRSKIEPGKKEEWRIKIKDKKGNDAGAEVLASMYDMSLDAFRMHSWKTNFYNEYYNYIQINKHLFGLSQSRYYSKRMLAHVDFGPRTYEHLNWFDYSPGSYYPSYRGGRSIETMYALDGVQTKSSGVARADAAEGGSEAPAPPGNKSDLIAQSASPVVQLRKNLQETSFFFPALYAQPDSSYLISFETPEALTKWKLQLFAHTPDLKFVFGEKEIQTQKELMLTPNLPRFVRSGDQIIISSKINTLNKGTLEGKASLHLFDAITMKEVDSSYGNIIREKNFVTSNEKSANVSWTLKIPENTSALLVRITASSGIFTDGEENVLPVLSNRQLVTESMPFWTRGGETRKFEMNNLIKNASVTLQHERLKLEYTSNPIWTVVQALPYLMEYPYQCSEQVFSRFYANSLAAHIANSSPRIKEIFNTWKKLSPESFLSNLEKNQDLKSVLLAETPWVLDAKNEKEQKERIALLFDLNRMSNEKNEALRKLQKQQMASGAWPWFEGMPENRFITQHIVIGLLQLQHLSVLTADEQKIIDPMLETSVAYLDRLIAEDFKKIKAERKEAYVPDPLQLQYLYLRSFTSINNLTNKSLSEHNYFLEQSAKYWLKYNEYLQGMNAIIQFRNGKKLIAKDIMNSLKNNSLHSDEFGMYWKNINGGYYWTDAAVEAQAMLIEAFKEVSGDKKAIEEMKIWLLRQKQTHQWKTTKATVAACYALLMTGEERLREENVLLIKVGNESFKTNDASLNREAGTGNFSLSWDAADIKNNMGEIRVTPIVSASEKQDSIRQETSVSWGALYWQYFEDLDKIKEADTKAISLKKNLFVQRSSLTGTVIEKIDSTSKLELGDIIVVRIELRTDRAMEFLHLKDMRAAGFEPENVLSQYKWQDGFGYYESTGDVATNFFISYLPKGVYVFEYRLRIFQSGIFSAGITSIQNMYAPEFSAHSAGNRIQVIAK